MSTEVINKIQFKVLLTNNQFISLLTSLKNKAVNISALSVGPVEECLFVLRFVTNNVSATQQSLIELCLDFTTTTVLLVTVPSIPGGLQNVFIRLYCYVTIIATYIDESLGQIIEFDDVDSARRLLTGTFPICPEQPTILNECCTENTLCCQ